MLVATNSYGCTDTATALIVVTIEPSTLFFPNVFSPNEDGNNDLFSITSTGIKDFECNIFDRWGLKMWTLDNAHSGWDGRTAGGVKVSEGTYFYIIKATGWDGKTYDKQGAFLLVR